MIYQGGSSRNYVFPRLSSSLVTAAPLCSGTFLTLSLPSSVLGVFWAPLSQMTYTPPHFHTKYVVWGKVNFSVEDPFIHHTAESIPEHSRECITKMRFFEDTAKPPETSVLLLPRHFSARRISLNSDLDRFLTETWNCCHCKMSS